MTRVRLVSLVLMVMLIGINERIGYAWGKADGVSTYERTEYSSVGSVFGDGAKVYVMVMDWVQTKGGSAKATVTNGTKSISVNIYDDGTSPDTKANDGHYWGLFTIGTRATDDDKDYLHLDDGKEAAITADVGNNGNAGTGTILAYYNINPTKIVVKPGKSIQKAINSLPPGGGIVELAAGVHEVDETIIVNKSNITVRGPRGAVIKFRGGRRKNLFKVPAQKPRLYNLHFKGFEITNTYVGRSGAIVHASEVKHLTVEDILHKSGNFHGGFLTVSATAYKIRSENIFAKNNRARDRSCISIAFTKNGHMVGNVIPRSGRVGGLNVNRTNKFIYVRDNYSANAANHSLRLHSAGYVHVCGNTIVGSREGISGDGVRPAIIENNIIYNASNAGIEIGPQPTLKWKVANNRIYNCNIGIYTTHCDHGFSGHKTSAEITNNVIYGCHRDGIKMNSPYVALEIKGNIITNNGGYGINYMKTTELPTTIKYNNVWGNAKGNYGNTATGTGDISADPLFADSVKGDFHLRSKAGRWDPKSKKWVKDKVQSPCIDAGDPKAGFSKEPVPNGGRLNMGAYGDTKEASKSTVQSRREQRHERNEGGGRMMR